MYNLIDFFSKNILFEYKINRNMQVRNGKNYFFFSNGYDFFIIK